MLVRAALLARGAACTSRGARRACGRAAAEEEEMVRRRRRSRRMRRKRIAWQQAGGVAAKEARRAPAKAATYMLGRPADPADERGMRRAWGWAWTGVACSPWLRPWCCLLAARVRASLYAAVRAARLGHGAVPLPLLQLYPNLVCQHVGAHDAYDFVDKLVHVDCVNVVVERAQEAFSAHRLGATRPTLVPPPAPANPPPSPCFSLPAPAPALPLPRSQQGGSRSRFAWSWVGLRGTGRSAQVRGESRRDGVWRVGPSWAALLGRIPLGEECGEGEDACGEGGDACGGYARTPGDLHLDAPIALETRGSQGSCGGARVPAWWIRGRRLQPPRADESGQGLERRAALGESASGALPLCDEHPKKIAAA